MAGIRKKTYKNKNGAEKTKYYIVYKDINGNQCSGGGYETKREAQSHLKEFENIESESDVTLKYIFDLFKSKMNKYANTTQNMYNSYYNRFFKEIENVKYRKLTSVYLQDLFDKIEAISPYIAVICLKMWKSATNNAIKKRIINTNKFNDIDTIKTPKTNKNHLTVNLILQMLEIAKTKFCKKYYTMFFTFIGTGMRAGEILALSKQDFDYNKKILSVNKQYTHGELKFKPKTDSSIREVFLFQELADAILDYLPEVEGDILFPNQVGGYIMHRNFSERFWKSLKKEAGITERVRLHDLRGSYVDLVLSSGLSPKFAQNQLGHAKTQTTLDIYAKNNEDMVMLAETKIGEFFKSGGKTVEKNEEVEKPKVISFSEARAKRNKKAPFGTF